MSKQVTSHRHYRYRYSRRFKWWGDSPYFSITRSWMYAYRTAYSTVVYSREPTSWLQQTRGFNSIFSITRVSYLKKTAAGSTSKLAVLVESEVSNNLRAKMFIPWLFVFRLVWNFYLEDTKAYFLLGNPFIYIMSCMCTYYFLWQNNYRSVSTNILEVGNIGRVVAFIQNSRSG